MYTLARVFQALAERKPDLDAGVYAYAKAGFGDYLGFLSAFGYFIIACLRNTFYWVHSRSGGLLGSRSVTAARAQRKA
jgi:arginine:ornithine antiporter/lysine permease